MCCEFSVLQDDWKQGSSDFQIHILTKKVSYRRHRPWISLSNWATLNALTLNLQLALEQHRFELLGFAYEWPIAVQTHGVQGSTLFSVHGWESEYVRANLS